jgi:hypothetical protein
MTITAVSGPTVSFGTVLTSCGADLEHNPDRGPSFADLGEGLLDPRPQFMFQPGAASSKAFYGWAGLFGGPVVDAIPQTLNSAGIAASQVPVGGTALTFTTTATSSSFVTATITAPESGQNISVLAIDGSMGGKAFGVSGGPNLWDPTRAICRTLSITGSSNGSTAEAWSIAGRDLYGFKQTELVIGASIAVNTKKAYKYISSIIPSTVNGAIGSTGVTVGTNDVYGFPLRVDNVPYLTIYLGPSSAAGVVNFSTAGNHLFAVTSAASNTTGDVRGTYASSVASNSTQAAPIRVAMFISPSVQNLATVTSTNFSGLVGLTQFSSV